jgi:CRISPR/Cas system-associated exonuclease Cas4 (RecB family)
MNVVGAYPDAPKTRDYVTPSGATALALCGLKMAYSTASAARWIGTPATRLGNLCHEVLAAAAKGELGATDAPEWRAQFDAAWMRAQDAEVAEVELHLRPGAWPAPERWYGFQRSRVATRRLAGELSVLVANGGILRPEVPLSALGNRLRGRPDLVIREPVHEIRDYKTGRIDGEPGELKTTIAAQMNLYALLEAESSGSWPDEVVVVPLRGERVPVEIQPGTAEALAQSLLVHLDSYNAAVLSAEVDRLADPHPDACDTCAFATGCPEFWAAGSDAHSSEVAAVAGVLTEMRLAAGGRYVAELDVLAGCTTGAATVYGLDPHDHAGLGQLSTGDTLGLTKLTDRGEGSGFQVRPWSMVRKL